MVIVDEAKRPNEIGPVISSGKLLMSYGGAMNDHVTVVSGP